MSITELDQIIGEIVKTSNLKKDEIINDLADYAKLKFGNAVTEVERKLIDTVKVKIIDGYYNMKNHSYVTMRPDFKGMFGFDDLEMKVLPKAKLELEKEDLFEGAANYTKLNEKGVLKAKRQRGDL
jgi:hypothetical protein